MYNVNTDLEKEFDCRWGPTAFHGKKIGRWFLCVWPEPDNKTVNEAGRFYYEIRYHCARMEFGRVIMDAKDNQILIEKMIPKTGLAHKPELINVMNQLNAIAEQESQQSK